MTLPLRTLSVAERWDCHGCGICCRATIIPLNDGDVARIREQQWENHPDYRGTRVIVRDHLWRRRFRLARRRDGNCIFWTDEGLCRIHQEYGLKAKPLICQMFPLQLVPMKDFAYLTVRRSCPSAGAERGRELKEHLHDALEMAQQGDLAAKAARPPAILPGRRASWHEVLLVAELLERLLLDPQFPLVRRIVHGLEFCRLLGMCRLEDMSGEKLVSLLGMLQDSALDESGAVFQQRRAPDRATGMLFRQTAMEYVRLHPKFVVEKSWRERWRLVRAATAFYRGQGPVPFMHECFPETTFEALDKPLGHLDEEVLRPLVAYFEAVAGSKRYAVLNRPGWSLVEGYRDLALAYPIALWLLRLQCGDRPPEPDDMIDVVGALDRAERYAGLTGRRHRRRITWMARVRGLPRLVAWYGR